MTDAGQFRSDAPWRHAFDNARDPYTARNALGLTSLGGSGGGAPVDAQYIIAAADPTLTAEWVLTDSATIAWDFTTPGQVKANSTAGGGNVSNVGTPAADDFAVWTTATTIKGITPAAALTAIGAQPAGSYQPLAPVDGVGRAAGYSLSSLYRISPSMPT